MGDLLSSVLPAACDWYEPSGMYEGGGTVFSETLQRPIMGMFTIEWSEVGDVTILCTPTDLELHNAMRIAEDFDKFRDLNVVVGSGRFSAKRCYLKGPQLSFGSGGTSMLLRFHISAGTFVASDEIVPSLWNAPLTNFIGDFRPRSGATVRHPLRVYRMPSIPDGLPSDLRTRASMAAVSKNRFITFESACADAIIERLPTYDGAATELNEKRASIRATCLMAGSIPPGGGVKAEEVEAWFPEDALVGLTLASGTRVGMGFVDLRDADARLHSRIHLAYAGGRYIDGHPALSDLAHGTAAGSGIGGLLTGLLKTDRAAMHRIRLLCAAIDLAQDALGTPDHAFAFIVRALDGLANDLGVSRNNLAAELPAATDAVVKQVLAGASSSIRGLAGATGSAADAKMNAVLSRIADRARSADATEDKFSLSLSRVLDHYKLNDVTAMAAFYKQHPRADGLGWLETLDLYRGRTIHRGFIDYSGGIQIMDVVCVARHLVDIAMRICMLEAGYSGTYNPFNMSATQLSPLDWVKGEREIRQFGYNGLQPKMIKLIGFDDPNQK
jgi:hypothetical protein